LELFDVIWESPFGDVPKNGHRSDCHSQRQDQGGGKRRVGHRLLFTLSRCNKYAANYHIGSLLGLHPRKCVTIKKRLRGDGERNDRCGLYRNRRFDRYDWLVDLGRGSRKAVQVIAPFCRPQSFSASRFTAGAFGFLILIQCLERCAALVTNERRVSGSIRPVTSGSMSPTVRHPLGVLDLDQMKRSSRRFIIKKQG
jgi:hypothetical protein